VSSRDGSSIRRCELESLTYWWSSSDGLVDHLTLGYKCGSVRHPPALFELLRTHLPVWLDLATTFDAADADTDRRAAAAFLVPRELRSIAALMSLLTPPSSSLVSYARSKAFVRRSSR
jgi:hypothetical protein